MKFQSKIEKFIYTILDYMFMTVQSNSNKKIDDDDMIFDDVESYKSKTTIGIKEIALKQFQKCCNELSKEMTRGGTITRFVNGEYIQVGVPDQIQIFVNSVIALKIILQPKIVSNAIIMQGHNNIFKNTLFAVQQQKNKRSEEHYTNFYNINSKRWTNLQRMGFKERMIADLRDIDEEYDTNLLEVYKQFFEGLSVLMDSLNYFDEEVAGYSPI